MLKTVHGDEALSHAQTSKWYAFLRVESIMKMIAKGGG
jgi:hypothetical protein